AAFLAKKKQALELAHEVRQGARQKAAALHEGIAAGVRDARTRAAMAAPGGARLLLDAAYLVARSDARRFQKNVSQLAGELGPGFDVRLSGPWPPYHFVEKA